MRLALANSLSAHRPPPVGGPLSGILAGLGLTDGLKLCLDAGDINSWPGSGQKWLDTSGNGHDFFLGADGSATSTDPTPTGTPGGLAAGNYMAFDGGDYLTYDTTNETWMQNLHKDNAQFWAATWVMLASTAASQGLFGTNAGGTSSAIGFHWNTSTGTPHTIGVTNGSGNALSQTAAGSAISTGVWHFLAFSINEAVANSLFFITDDVSTTRLSAYSSPSSSDATHTAQIAARGNANLPSGNGAKMAMFCMGEGVSPTSAQLLALRAATRGRFGV